MFAETRRRVQRHSRAENHDGIPVFAGTARCVPQEPCRRRLRRTAPSPLRGPDANGMDPISTAGLG